jgi:hypothetical protein
MAIYDLIVQLHFGCEGQSPMGPRAWGCRLRDLVAVELLYVLFPPDCSWLLADCKRIFHESAIREP